MIGNAFGWNWWEIVSYWRGGSCCWEWGKTAPRRAVLPFVLPIVMTPPTLRHDRGVCRPI